MPSNGSILQGRYRVEQVLGTGGMSAVYLGTDLRLDRQVAVKATSLPFLSDAERAQAAAQFESEARLLASIRHPHIVEVFDSFEEGGVHYLVMEYIEGRDLQGVLESATTPLDVSLILDWAESICNALEALHEHRPPVVFRDLKPANLVLDPSARLRLIDFGISHAYQEGMRTITFLMGAGTEGFAPLEQYSGGTGPCSDIYALGATMYALLTGDPPPPAPLRAAGTHALRSLASTRSDVPPDLEAAIERMLSLRKEDRFQTMAEVRAALRASPIHPWNGAPPAASTSPIPPVAAAPSPALPAPMLPPPPMPAWAVLPTAATPFACTTPAPISLLPSAPLLDYASSFTVVFRGDRERAEQAAAGSRLTGRGAMTVFSRDLATMFPGQWVVLVSHFPSWGVVRQAV